MFSLCIIQNYIPLPFISSLSFYILDNYSPSVSLYRWKSLCKVSNFIVLLSSACNSSSCRLRMPALYFNNANFQVLIVWILFLPLSPDGKIINIIIIIIYWIYYYSCICIFPQNVWWLTLDWDPQVSPNLHHLPQHPRRLWQWCKFSNSFSNSWTSVFAFVQIPRVIINTVKNKIFYSFSAPRKDLKFHLFFSFLLSFI